MSAFYANFHLIRHNVDIIDFAYYNCGDSETSADNHFVIKNTYTDIALKHNRNI